jgi:hypothetical protein
MYVYRLLKYVLIVQFLFQMVACWGVSRIQWLLGIFARRVQVKEMPVAKFIEQPFQLLKYGKYDSAGNRNSAHDPHDYRRIT